MGRKKKGDFSRDEVMKVLNKSIDTDNGDSTANSTKGKKAKPKAGNNAIRTAKSAKVKKNLTQEAGTLILKTIQDSQLPQSYELKKKSGAYENIDEDVFEDDIGAEYEDDIAELTRLMSVCNVAKDSTELEEQLNLAAYQQFLIRLPSALHPAIKAHLSETFKSICVLPSSSKLEEYPSITYERIEEKLTTLSEIAGFSFNLILAPPSSECLKCSKQLMPQLGLATNIMVFDVGGPKIATKYRYRCRECPQAGCDLSYHPDQWGSPDRGYQFYDSSYEYIRASRVTWISRKQTEYFFASMHHVWASQEGSAEAYNEAFLKDALKVKVMDIKLSGKADWALRHSLYRKSLSRALRLYLIEEEMRSLNQNWVFPIYSAYTDAAYDEHLVKIDEYRIKDGYVHHCGDYCRSQGCIYKGHDMVHAIDGLWKLSYPHCMWYLPNKNLEFELDIPPVCTNQPSPSSAFCIEHKEVCEKLGVDSSLQGFLRYCGVEGEEYTKDKSRIVESSLKNLHMKAKKNKQTKDADIQSTNTPVFEQGTSMTLRPRGGLLNSKKIDATQEYIPPCNKDTTGKQRLQKWTRGCFAIVNSAGLIRYWAPLFKSEGPAQVAVIVLTFMLTILCPSVPFDQWEKLVLSYDNMCHLDSLKMFRKPLPAKGKFALVWQKITKVIDDLHCKNHVEVCKQTWNPDKIREVYPKANLVCCEQTFAWLGRFKKILNQMGKVHHHFFLHCLVKRRNEFTTRMYEEGRRLQIDIDVEVDAVEVDAVED